MSEVLPKPARLEHINITVSDIAASARLFEDIFGWSVRWSGQAAGGGSTIHVGTQGQYVAVYQPPGARQPRAFSKSQPLNHLCLQVDDLAATEARVIAFGLVPVNHGDYEPGRRFYFYDDNGIEFEVVSYA